MKERITTLKKIVSLVFVLLIALTAVSAFAFDDMPDDWSTQALQSAVNNGLLSGYDNKLHPKDNLTRAQMATILVRALGATETADISAFTDVKTSSWYYSAMATSYKMQIFKGDGAGKLNPDNNITRQEAFVVLSRAFSLSSTTTTGLAKFSDADEVASWAKEGIEALVVNGYVGGSNGKLNPNAYITRAEFAQVMYNLIKAYTENEIEVIGMSGINGNLIIRGHEINSLKNVVINGDLIIGDGAPSNIKFENVTVKGRLVIRAAGTFTFDGTADELVLTADNSKAVISKDSSVSKVTVNSATSSYEIEGAEDKDTSGTTGGNTGGGNTGGGNTGGGNTGGGNTGGGNTGGETGGGNTETPEEDIWTEFH